MIRSRHIKIVTTTVDGITARPGLAIRHQILVTLLPNTAQLMWSNPQTFIIVKMFSVNQNMCIATVMLLC